MREDWTTSWIVCAAHVWNLHKERIGTGQQAMTLAIDCFVVHDEPCNSQVVCADEVFENRSNACAQPLRSVALVRVHDA